MPDWNNDHHTTRELVLSAAILQQYNEKGLRINKKRLFNILDLELSDRSTTENWVEIRTVAVGSLTGQGVLLFVPDLLNSCSQLANLGLQRICLVCYFSESISTKCELAIKDGSNNTLLSTTTDD